jgi:hypothetical protein
VGWPRRPTAGLRAGPREATELSAASSLTSIAFGRTITAFGRTIILCIGRGLGRLWSISTSSSTTMTTTTRQPWRAPLLARAIFLHFTYFQHYINGYIINNNKNYKYTSDR